VDFLVEEGAFGLSNGVFVCFPLLELACSSIVSKFGRALAIPLFFGVSGDFDFLREFVPCFVENVHNAPCEALNALYGCDMVRLERVELACNEGVVFHFLFAIVLDASFY